MYAIRSYYDQDLSGDGSLRNMRAEKLFFNEDGSIQKVIPTRRGIGIRKASEQIQVARFDEGTESLKSLVLRITSYNVCYTKLLRCGYIDLPQ